MGKGTEKQVNILEIPDDIGYWLLRADGGKYYEDFFLNNFIAISDNEITLEMINDSQKNTIAGNTVDHYKGIYQDNYPEWTNQQIAHAASRTQKFLDEMKIGDLVLVPSKRSVNFLLGIITSDVIEVTEEDIILGEKVNYSLAPYLKRREVQWLKVISRSEISEKLYWLLSAHQTIFNLQDQRDYINQLLSPIYIQNGTCHGTVKISKKEGLNSNEWYNLYSTIKKYADPSDNEVVIKTNVQSPGWLEFVVDNPITTLTIITVLSAPIIGEINLKVVQVKGILPFFLSYKKEQLEMKKMKKEMEIMEEDKKAKQIDNKRAAFELDREMESWQIKKEIEAEQLRKQLQISSFDAGKLVGGQTQTDISEIPNADELEKIK